MNDALLFVAGPLPGAALVATYDAALVVLSYVVASLAAYTAIDLAGRVSEFRAERWKSLAWLAGGAFSMGAGIWSMHFVAMLAYQLPIPVRYELGTTLASMAVAIVIAGFALFLVTRGSLSWRRLGFGGGVMGLGIATMHYTGMAAMRLDAVVMYYVTPWTLSILNAIVCSTIALWLVFRLESTGPRIKLLAALVMGVAVSGMHYTGMYATVCVSTGQTAAAAVGLDPVPLAVTIAAVTLLIIGVTLAVSLQSQLLSRTLKQQNDLLRREVEQRRNAEAELQAATDSLAAYLRRQEKIAGLGQFALGKREPSELIEEALRRVRESLAADAVAYVEPGPGERQLALRAMEGLRQEQRASMAAYSPDAAIARVLAGGNAARVVARSPAEAALPFDWAGSFPSALLVPVAGEQRVRGVLCALSASPDALGPQDTRFVEAAARVLSIGLRRIDSETQLAFLAQFDALTGLPNRSLISDRLAQVLTQAKRNRGVAGVMFVDLDRFKFVNDTYGHGTGDKLLKLVAQRLQECVRSGDSVGRLSGDEFAIVLANLAKADDANLVAQKVLAALGRPFDLDGHQTYMGASLGIALFPGDGEEPQVLLKNADTAMFRAKELGRNTYQFYLPTMNERAAARLGLETDLRAALERGEFLLHYQPKANLADGKISGFEALLRWQHPQRGLVPPLEFVSILEDTGLIAAVGEWVMREACAQLKRWQAQGVTPRPVAVNLSARQFQEKNLDSVIAGILAEYRIDPALLELELTESMLMNNAEAAAQTLARIKASGVRLAIDDFGTGYSSLAYLRRFPIDVLKIDRTFIRNAATDPDDAAIVLAMISLAHGMNVKVVAEGVETEAQVNFLRLRGCDELQGYYFARPVPATECTRALVEDRRLKTPALDPAPGAPAILLVDDSYEDLEVLKRTLAPDGYHILTANSAAAGFEALARSAFQIVISDYLMPGMNGAKFLAGVRMLYPRAVRIVVSASDDIATVANAVNTASIHKFIRKEWDPAQKRAAVREAYRQHRERIA